ncbi:MAG: ABC transporter substrate-binding protein [Alphaproteobacteria bacterium]|nr:ABC transporter substrate-binding protein [Alphaproteobacteria bacterium]
MHRLTVTLAAAVLALGAVGTTVFQSARADTPADTLVIADRIDDIVTLDPAEIFEFAGTDLANNVYDTLVELDPADMGPLVPGIAESWSVADDGVTYTFKLREDLKFASGNPITAEDAAFSLRRVIILEKTPSFILTQFGFTKDNVADTIKATGKHELTIRTDKPYAPSFVYNCLTAPVASIVDKTLAMQHEANGDLGHEWMKTNSAGSGAYVLRSWKPNESYVLDVNKGYWRGEPAMKRIFVRHIPESSTQRLLLEKGDVDIARHLSADDVVAISDDPDLKVEDDLKGRIMYIAMNQKDPILGKPKVVEAMKHLIDYQGMSDSFLRGQFVVHQAFLPLTYLGELKDKPYKLDVAKAKSLLAEAGHADGFEVKIYVRTVYERMEMAQSLQNTFGQAGIKVSLVTGTGKQILTQYRARQHQIYLGAWGPDYPDPHTNADTFAHNADNSEEAKLTGKLAWRNAWDIPEMTKMTEAAVQEKDAEKRADMYRKIQRVHQQTSPFAPMFQRIIQNAMRKNVNGFNTGSAVHDVFYWTVTK